MASIPEETRETPADQQDGFGAAFSERAKALTGTETEAAEDGNKPSTDEPAEEAGSEAAPAEAATEETTSGTAEEADPWAGLTPEQLRQRLTESEADRVRLQASERSQRGRVGALTRKLNTIQAKGTAPEAAPEKKPKEGEAGDEGGNADDRTSRLKHVADEYSDVVGPLVEEITDLRAKIDKIDSAATTREEVDADSAELAEAYGKLEKVHPDFRQYDDSNAQFTEWLGKQTAKTQALANSYDPEEVSLVLSLFKAERSAATETPSGDGGEQGQEDGTATDDRRKRQLEGSKQVPGSGQAAAAGVPNDFSSAFKARAKKHQRA